MRRLSRPQSSESPLEPSPQRCPSPVLQPEPDQAARTAPDSATPSVLYRSSFAQECEAVVYQLSNAAEAVRPRWTVTIQEETLTPLEPPCSFLASYDGGSPSRSVPEPASASVGPPDPSAALPCGEHSARPAEASPGDVARPGLAAMSPVSGLVGVLSWPELEKDSPPPPPPPSGANITYECNGSGDSANATYICTGSFSAGEKRMSADAASAQPAPEVCKLERSFVTSTPLMSSPLSKDTFPTTLCTGCPRGCVDCGSDSKQKPSADPQRDSGSRILFASNHRSLPAAVSSGTDRVPHVSDKTPVAKRSLSLGASRALRGRGSSGIRGLPKRIGTTRNISQPAGGNHLQNFVMPPARSGSTVQSQPIAQKLLPDARAKTELPCNKKPPISIQPPFKLAGKSGVQASLACLGLKFRGVSRDDDVSGTRLPVLAGNKVTAKTSSQKRPWERSSDKAATSPLKQPFSKRSRLWKSQKEKPTCSDLTAVGKTPIAALEKELTAPCSQCRWLAEENQRLKSMLETCHKTIAFLEGKQTVVENENCPPQTEAT